MEYYLYMTNDCNLMCEYCSVLFDCEKNHIPLQPAYPVGDLLACMEKTQKQSGDSHIYVFFFGGEPTMEYGIIERYMEAVSGHFQDYDVKYVLHTNGLLLHEIPDLVLDRLSLIILSFNYEKIPRDHLKESYFSVVMENLLYVREKSGVPVLGRLTVTEQTSLYTEAVMTGSFCDYIYFQIENCSRFHDGKSFYQTYTFELELLYRIWKKQLQNGILQKVIPFMAVLKFMFFHDRDDNEFCCGYDRHQVYVQTTGECYSCCDSVPEGVHHAGDLKSGICFHGYKLTDFTCKDCSYRSLCMGRCGRMHIEFDKEHIGEYCRMNQFMFDLFKRDEEDLKKALEQAPDLKEELDHWIISITELTP